MNISMPPPIDNRTLSLIISGRLDDVSWETFSENEWNFLIAKAQAEGVAPLVYWVLSHAQKLSQLSPSMRDSLRLMYASTWAQNRGNFKELETLARTFAQANISIVALKGVCYALTIYPDIGLRPMGDMDLLVPRSKLSDAAKIAKTMGYVDERPEVYPGLKYLFDDEISLKKMGIQVFMLELHNSLLSDKSFTYAVPVEWFWSHTEPLMDSLQGRFGNLRMLTPTAQVLYASAHLILKHGNKVSLRWFYDLDSIIRSYSQRMDWDMLLSQAKVFEWGSALDAALSQSHIYFDTPIPDRVLVALSESTDSHRRWVALRQIRPATHILEELQNLHVLKWYGRFIKIFGLLVPSPAYMRWRYQFTSWWVLPRYYLFRWWVIFKDLLSTIKAVLWPPMAEPGGLSE